MKRMRSFIQRARDMRKRFVNFTHPMAEMNQNYHGLLLADEIMTKFQQRGNKTGELLYFSLPSNMAEGYVVKAWFDPYNHHYNEIELRGWLANHVIFDAEGNIIGIRDEHEVLVCVEGSQDLINTYKRMRGMQ